MVNFSWLIVFLVFFVLVADALVPELHAALVRAPGERVRCRRGRKHNKENADKRLHARGIEAATDKENPQEDEPGPQGD